MALPLGELARPKAVTERENALSAPSGHLSQRERQESEQVICVCCVKSISILTNNKPSNSTDYRSEIIFTYPPNPVGIVVLSVILYSSTHFALNFSFICDMLLYRTVDSDATDAQCFQKYLLSGGMPYLANLRYDEAPSRQYLTDLFHSVQLKDILKRSKVRDVDLLERIIAYVMANVGTTFSASPLVKFFRNDERTVATETILNYLLFCSDAFLLFQVKRQDLQGKQILATNEKYYIADHGIREFLLMPEWI